MNNTTKTELLGKFISQKEVFSELQLRKSKYFFQSINVKHQDLINEALEKGWDLDKEFKTVVRLKKEKSHELYFEDRVWSLFACLGFTTLNRGSCLKWPYDKDDVMNAIPINVFAKDDESILLVACKSAKKNKKSDFEKDLNLVKNNIGGVLKTIKALFPDAKYKVKYILATDNYALNDTDKELLESFHGIHFDNETTDYYLNMFGQIGVAARYQLLGALFAGQEIPEMQVEIPAIRGKMGGHTYYAFSIEPEKLLKISYVLHRNKANTNMMPTYQRIIKKNRLLAIHKFIDDENGYFPNSIVVSIDPGKKNELEFQPANTQVYSAVADVGILHLPKRYRSVYIIDGQHRLYGYANSKYKEKNSIPVVAFLDLDRDEQVKLFMQINENQKAVSKNLRVTLNSDLLWTSSDYSQQMTALRSRVAIFLGENRNSPLFDKISIGEDKKAITSPQIDNALRKSSFLGKVTKNKIEELGVFYKGNLEEAYEDLTSFLLLSFDYLKDHLEEIWEKKDNIILINKGIYALLMIFSDLVAFALKENRVNDKSTPKQIYVAILPYLEQLVVFYKELDEETEKGLKNAYGAGGDIRYWRTLQQHIRNRCPKFNPEGLEEYLNREKKIYNTKAFEYIREIETFFARDFKERLINEYGEKSWFKKGVPPKIGEEAVKLMYQKNREIENESEECEEWDCVNIIAYREIALKNWKIFEKAYTRPSERKISGGKEAKTGWMTKVERLRNQNVHSYSVTEDEFYFLEEIHDWLIGNKEEE